MNNQNKKPVQNPERQNEGFTPPKPWNPDEQRGYTPPKPDPNKQTSPNPTPQAPPPQKK